MAWSANNGLPRYLTPRIIAIYSSYRYDSKVIISLEYLANILSSEKLFLKCPDIIFLLFDSPLLANWNVQIVKSTGITTK